MKVGVFNGVGVAGVTMAVCVWKKEATNVPTLLVVIALTSVVAAAGGCPADDPNRIAVNSMYGNIFRTFIFTSM